MNTEIAKRLEKLWLQRERDLRERDKEKMPAGSTRESDAVRTCRKELQKEFGLIQEATAEDFTALA